MSDYRNSSKVKSMKMDTGMETICACCIELKSKTSCVLISKIPVEKIFKFCTEVSITRSSDGRFYVCKTCKVSIDKDHTPNRCQKDIFGFINFPSKMFLDLENHCIPYNEKIKQDPEKKYFKLNRLEDFLLKPVIPFIRIGHLPRGRYFKLLGDLIMVSADVPETMNKILPIQQQLIAVALKRKITYSGHFIIEYIDKSKLEYYFQWFKKHNHLFKDMHLDKHLIDEFEQEAMKLVETEDTSKNDLVQEHDSIAVLEEFSEEDHESEDKTLEQARKVKKEKRVTCETSSLISDKYMEDIKSNTVANRFSDMIVAFEKNFQVDDGNFEALEQNFYAEDDIFQSEESDDEEEESTINDEDKESWSYLATIKKETRIPLSILRSQILELCKCEIEKKISVILHFSYELEDFQSQNGKLITLKTSLLKEFKACISSSREVFKNIKSDCHHEVKNLQNEFRNIIEEGGNTDEFVRKQLGKIKNIVANISVAPSEHGEFKNWRSELFLEEKLFPNLFPYGIGGYMSSNLLRGSTMGFANYIKSRILSADPKFRDDKTYLLFMLLVKELTDIKNSEQTFLRKSTKSSNLTASMINSIGKENLYRYDSAFVSFKNIRGTTMYFQDAKKRLMATLRQKGPPTLFVTFSCAEYEWLELAKSIYETVYKIRITVEEIKNLSAAERNKLVSDNVVQTTLHYSKRTDKLMSLLKSGGIFFHNGEEYIVDSYFYRIEFQARGAPHSHCLLWLRSKENKSPPSMWSDEIQHNEDLCNDIASFCDSIMSGSSDDMHCEKHEAIEQDCAECQKGKNMVDKFQQHKHSFSCHKKGKKNKNSN